MDPYALITCRTQEQKSSVATGSSTHEWNETFVACCGVGLWLACTMGVGWGLLLGCWVEGWVGVGGGGRLLLGGGCGVCCVDTSSKFAGSIGLGPVGWGGVGGWGSGGLGQLGVGRAVLVVFYILGAALMAVLIHPAKLLVEVFFIVVLLALWYS
ncbi:hypothetical protein U1Q18_000182 [Sarracenia purpurea var. burkii]